MDSSVCYAREQNVNICPVATLAKPFNKKASFSLNKQHHYLGSKAGIYARFGFLRRGEAKWGAMHQTHLFWCLL